MRSVRRHLPARSGDAEPSHEADPVVKGQTATSSYKPAVLENGVR